MKTKNKNLGFTLIELLVVVAIIGLISSIVFASLSTARKKARDVKRMQDLYQIRIALEMYFNANGYYPSAGGGGLWLRSSSSAGATDWGILATALAPYISQLPRDPINNGTNLNGPWVTGVYSYAYGRYNIDTSRYDLIAQFENTTNENRCELKGYLFHSHLTAPPERPWCAPYANNWGYSQYMYADH